MTIGPFSSQSVGNDIVISRDKDTVKITASELYTVSKLIAIALNYAAGKALPPAVQWDKFQVRFAEDGNHVLERTGEEGGVVITEADGDDLIQLLGSSLNSHVDGIRLTGGPRKGVSTIRTPDPIVSGRD